MKRFLIGFAVWVFLVLLGMLAQSSYAETSGLFLFTDVPFGTSSWDKAMDGSWHIDRGVVSGLHGVLALDPGTTLSIKDGIILDPFGGQQNQQESYGYNNRGLGFGAVGNKFDVCFKVSDPNNLFAMSFNYQLKSWFVNDYTYGPEYLISPSALVQGFSINLEVKLF